MGYREKIFELSHVSKSYKSKTGTVDAVKDISLDIYEGEIFGIIGMSGAGKSTLVRMLNRLENATSGVVSFSGNDINNMPTKQLRKTRQSIGMIFQGFNLLSQKTVLANVLLPMKIAKFPKDERKPRALEMLKLVGLEEKIDTYPSQLSGGQKQRVAIARALASNPKVLLCDEATSALDPKTTIEILDLLKDINKKLGITIIIITHDMSVVEKICDRVAIVDKGTLAEIGDVSDIFTSPKSKAAKHLVYPIRPELTEFSSSTGRCVRIAFDDTIASEPIIADMVLATGEKVSILAANTKSVGGIGYGQMIIELPDDDKAADKITKYLKEKKVFVSEVEVKGGAD